MKIAERIDVENIRETGSKAQVLEETREHVPGITLHAKTLISTSNELTLTKLTYRNDAMIYIPNVDTIAADKGPKVVLNTASWKDFPFICEGSCYTHHLSGLAAHVEIK